MQSLDLPRDAVRGRLACSVRSSFLPAAMFHFMKATLVLQVARISRLAKTLDGGFQTSQRSSPASAHACLHSKNSILSLLFFPSSSHTPGCLSNSRLHHTITLSIFHSFWSRFGHQTNPEFDRQAKIPETAGERSCSLSISSNEIHSATRAATLSIKNK